jgi:hypothetical protein
MPDEQHLPLSVQSVINYPRQAQVGKTYLMTIDLITTDDEWCYEEEEYAIYCMLETSPLFSSKPLGEPAVVLHRFGGSYGAAKYLLTAASEEMEGEIRLTLVNNWGVPIQVINLDGVEIREEVNSIPLVIGEQQVETSIGQTTIIETETAQGYITQARQDEISLKQRISALVEAEAANAISDNQYQNASDRTAQSLNLAIARLVNAGTNNFAIWVIKAPYPSGHIINDCVWSPHLSQVWLEWQQLFAQHSILDFPSDQPEDYTKEVASEQLPLDIVVSTSEQTTTYSGRLMQYFGNCLWEWVFAGAILNSLEHSRGIAAGQGSKLRLRLELRDPYLVAMPWELMQRPGQSAISLSHNVLFSRTTSDVEPLPLIRTDSALNILLVLGEDETLQLDQEAKILEQTLTQGNLSASDSQGYTPCVVHTLIKPTPEELIAKLETRIYNILFYVGHGLRGSDGGLLFLHEQATLNGIELAQVLTSTGVKLVMFNSCWGAQPAAVNHQSIPYSSLAEVMIRHGVPAALGMRDQIADEESLTFIEAFLQALRERKPIDEAVVVARQQLLTLYKFNCPAWTLPVLYLHPKFDGQLLLCLDENVTEMPQISLPGLTNAMPPATLRKLEKGGGNWLLQTRITRIGRTAENDIVIPDLSVSRQHAQIICRNSFTEVKETQSYFLRDDSTYGTLIFFGGEWKRIHRQEVPLESGMQIKFGSTRSDTWEFTIENS